MKQFTSDKFTPKRKRQFRVERIITQGEIQKKLMAHFQFHIGEDEATTPHEIFQAVMNISPDSVDTLTRYYWQSVINDAIRKLRREDKAFVIKRKSKYFVLKSQEEADYYKGVCDKAIERMEKAQVRADDWVDKEKWKKFKGEKKLKDRVKDIFK